MKLLKLILSEIFGLFVDDEFLAIAVLIVVALAAAIAHWVSVGWAGVALLVGCVVVVAASLARAKAR